jgi:hypothetical protein
MTFSLKMATTHPDSSELPSESALEQGFVALETLKQIPTKSYFK